MLPLEPVPMPILNIAESNFLDQTENFLGKNTKWEAHVAQQIPLPRSSSPRPLNKPGLLEQLEPETDDDMVVRDFMERPANDKRPPKSKCRPSLMIQNNFPSPLTSPDYIAMTIAAAELAKSPLQGIRGILSEMKKMPQGWSTCLKRSPPKTRFQNNDFYAIHMSDEEHHYEKLKEKGELQEAQEPKEKNMHVFYKLNIKDNIDLSNMPHEEVYIDENYESIEEQETAM